MGSPTFVNFLADMGARPNLQHSIERKDNAKGYEPGNCRWATRAEQNRNQTSNRFIEHDGRRLCVTDWARELGADPRRIFNRLARGWSEGKAVSAPLGG